MYDRSYYPLHEMEVGVSCLMSEDTSISASVCFRIGDSCINECYLSPFTLKCPTHIQSATEEFGEGECRVL